MDSRTVRRNKSMLRRMYTRGTPRLIEIREKKGNGPTMRTERGWSSG